MWQKKTQSGAHETTRKIRGRKSEKKEFSCQTYRAKASSSFFISSLKPLANFTRSFRDLEDPELKCLARAFTRGRSTAGAPEELPTTACSDSFGKRLTLWVYVAEEEAERRA